MEEVSERVRVNTFRRKCFDTSNAPRPLDDAPTHWERGQVKMPQPTRERYTQVLALVSHSAMTDRQSHRPDDRITEAWCGGGVFLWRGVSVDGLPGRVAECVAKLWCGVMLG